MATVAVEKHEILISSSGTGFDNYCVCGGDDGFQLNAFEMNSSSLHSLVDGWLAGWPGVQEILIAT